ncbi:phosphate transport system regulatory protein PhoU [Mycoplasmopsis californica]|uniref:Phosphate-specific transport system accessory protein PhoU n=1 Tax=Mycoplasmopsis equigenitalium TaxID=114883 RepID=A0ABY5J0B8_9BACT|nr:phosphate signaling complex protein PhoU [Mycoplasmopsis equigenitalium]UUD36707.1 phosphate signaling complex protein PhoU [Mycoplasmopsis equigenitalium]VEU70000.1 phosphate transport system regulatory protein PhoU [Mycoplasmopsis californica]
MTSSIVTNEILRIKKRLIELSNLVLTQHEKAYRSLVEHEEILAHSIIDDDQKVDDEMVAIKNEISFVLTKEPLAKYLRRAVSYLIIAKELERIGDYAKHIARFVLSVKIPSPSSVRRIKEIYDAVLHMLQSLTDNIEQERNELLLKLVEDDDVVDTKTLEVNKELIASFLKKQHTEAEISERVYLINLANSLERAGDHIVNICESLYYIINGKYIKL